MQQLSAGNSSSDTNAAMYNYPPPPGGPQSTAGGGQPTQTPGQYVPSGTPGYGAAAPKLSTPMQQMYITQQMVAAMNRSQAPAAAYHPSPAMMEMYRRYQMQPQYAAAPPSHTGYGAPPTAQAPPPGAYSMGAPPGYHHPQQHMAATMAMSNMLRSRMAAAAAAAAPPEQRARKARKPPPRSGYPAAAAQLASPALSEASPYPQSAPPAQLTEESIAADDDDDYNPRGNRKSAAKGGSTRRTRVRKDTAAAAAASESSSYTGGTRPSRRAATNSSWAWADEAVSESPTRATKRRRVGGSRQAGGDADADWVNERLSSDDGDDAAWTSDVDSELLSAVGSRSQRTTATKSRRRPARRRGSWMDEDDAVYSGVDEDEADEAVADEEDLAPVSTRKRAVCVLDVPSATGPSTLGVDKVVGHVDVAIDSITGDEIPLSNSGAASPGGAAVTAPAPVVTAPEGCRIERRFIIKWTGKSHLHNTAMTLEHCQALNVAGIKKITNYIKKQAEMETQKLHMSEDEVEQMVIALELQRQLDQDALIPERIVTHTLVPAPPLTPQGTDEVLPSSSASDLITGDGMHHVMGEGGEADGLMGPAGSSPSAATYADVNNAGGSSSLVTVYLVKWTSCPYDQCTWETEAFLQENNFGHMIEAYRLRESRICGSLSCDNPLNQHDLSETSFEPYNGTPPYLGGDKQMQLRDYQITGVNWIISRMKKDLSVLLADEMGLGKTAQTISVVGHMAYAEKVAGPFLIVVPQSTMDNWLQEFQQWLPNLNVILHHGNPAAREVVRREEMKIVQASSMSRTAYEAFVQPRGRLTSMNTQNLKQVIAKRVRYRCDVVITTTSILQCPEDLEFLRAIPWYFMAVDEAHQLKNRESKRFKELCLFRPRYKLLLSGTPLHNNLEELWSLLHFMNPSIYNSLPLFQQKYSEIEKTDSVGELKARQLNQMERELREVVLRRVKKDVLKSLPNKVEWILRVELSPRQASLCKDVVLRNYESLSKSTGGSKLSLQNICVELKKICNHPFLLHCPEDRESFNKELLWSSGKMCLLDKLLTRLKEKGHRVLIFSQMVRMLNLLSTFLTIRGFKHQRLDGTMSRDVRKKAMDHFNAPGSDDFCFLLSTKAGGLGINLTSADTVIIYDSDWNPQNDLQAEARAHRIGQTKTVQIYRVVTKDSVEEDILERAKAKMVLDALVVQGLNVKAGIKDTDLLNGTGGAQGKNSGFNREELTKILMFGATKLWQKKETSHEDGGQATDDDSVKIDLDKVLAEAEEHTDQSGNGRAEDLLSSFSNVSDFRYEAPKQKEEDKLAWDQIIPLEERVKIKGEAAAAAPAEAAAPTTRGGRKGGRSAKRAAATGRDLYMAAGGDVEEDDFRIGDLADDDSDEGDSSDAPLRSSRRRGGAASRRKAGSGSTRARAGATSGSKKAGTSSVAGASGKRSVASSSGANVANGVFADRERYRLSRAMIKFGSPAIRMMDVLDDAKLGKVDESMILEEAENLIKRCEAALAQAEKDATTTTTASGTTKKIPISISFGAGYACPCRELLDRVAHLESLHKMISDQNPDAAKPWLIRAQHMKLDLPEDATTANIVKLGDNQLLKGIYIHGFANWQKIAHDTALAEGVPDFMKKVKSDKIKTRAVKLLQLVHTLVTASSSPVPNEPTTTTDNLPSQSGGVAASASPADEDSAPGLTTDAVVAADGVVDDAANAAGSEAPAGVQTTGATRSVAEGVPVDGDFSASPGVGGVEPSSSAVPTEEDTSGDGGPLVDGQHPHDTHTVAGGQDAGVFGEEEMDDTDGGLAAGRGGLFDDDEDDMPGDDMLDDPSGSATTTAPRIPRKKRGSLTGESGGGLLSVGEEEAAVLPRSTLQDGGATGSEVPEDGECVEDEHL